MKDIFYSGWMIILAICFFFLGCTTKNQSSKTVDLSTLTLTKDLTISADNEGVLFGNFAGLTVDSDGNIYAADTKLQKIHLFSPNGNYLDSLGRKGKGPGEFNDLNPKIRIQSDTLYAMQNNARRIDLFDLKTQQSFRTISIPSTKINNISIGNPRNIYPLADGTFLVSFTNPYFKPPNKKEQSHFTTISKFDASGRFITQNVLQFPVQFPTHQKLVYLKSGGVSIFKTSFYPDRKIAIGPADNLYIGETDSLILYKYDQDGNMAKKFEGEHTSNSFTDADLDSLSQNKGKDFKKAVNKVGPPDYWPAFQHFLIDDEGRPWLQLLNSGSAQQEWRVFDKNGKLRWKFSLPAEIKLYEVKQGKVYGIVNPPKGVSSIVRYSVEF